MVASADRCANSATRTRSTLASFPLSALHYVLLVFRLAHRGLVWMLGPRHGLNGATKLEARLRGRTVTTSHPLVVHRGEAVHRASSHRDGGPKTALNVTNTAAKHNKSIRTTSAIFDRFCFVIMFAPLTERTLALTIADRFPA